MHIYLILLLCCILAGSEPHVQPISTISIVGERHSGTTFMYKLLETNIDMTSVRINENNLCGWYALLPE